MAWQDQSTSRRASKAIADDVGGSGTVVTRADELPLETFNPLHNADEGIRLCTVRRDASI